METILPEKYYLLHAREVFDFVGNQCAHLLQAEHQNYLEMFADLNEDSQCLLVRFITRKPQFLKRASLDYAEISKLTDCLSELSEQGLIGCVVQSDFEQFLEVLTKPQLLGCLRSELSVKTSVLKAELLTLAKHHVKYDNPALLKLAQEHYVRRQQEVIDYILFLFFGDLKNRLQQFAMRDLGVLKTPKKSKQQSARFELKVEALSSFDLHCKKRAFAINPVELANELAEYLLNLSPIGADAMHLKDKLVLQVGTELVTQDPHRAIELWRCSTETEAIERWVRASHKYGDRESLKIELETLRQQPLRPSSKIFIEDFYARKYAGKRTSVYTDILRESARCVGVDEAYIENVEHGVMEHYRRKNAVAFFTENRLWQMLFAFTFWDLLFGDNPLQHCEFDRLPAPLRGNQFYNNYQRQIEQRITTLDDRNKTRKLFCKLATENYQYPTGMFSWSAELLDSLITCIKFAPAGAIGHVLRVMSQDYQHTHCGYPDLMVIEKEQLRFEEVKAPGDSLRANQLLSINCLRSAGFKVDVTAVNWFTDPDQEYGVVDIETTGGRKGLHAITEIAVVKVRGEKIINKWSTLVNPQRPIPPFITRLTGINDHMVADAPTFYEIAEALESQLEGVIFVAHNVGFDYGFIKAAYAGINRPFYLPKICTVRSSKKTFPGLKSYALGNICAHLDIDLKQAHRALSDANATADLLIRIQEARRLAA